MTGATRSLSAWFPGVAFVRDGLPRPSASFLVAQTHRLQFCRFSRLFLRVALVGAGVHSPFKQPVVFPWLAAPSFQKAREIDTCSLLPKLRSLSALAEIVARLSPAFTIARNLAG